MYCSDTNVFFTSIPVNCEEHVLYEDVDGSKSKFERVITNN